jgi:hypothetical protein
MQTKADKIRLALKANPNAKATDIAKALGIDPQEIYMVRYNDKKRARLKARKARAKKAQADFYAFNDIANKLPTIKQVTKPSKRTPEQERAADYLVALNRASTNAERAVKETEKLRETLAANSMHPVATIAISVVASVLIVFVLGGIV